MLQYLIENVQSATLKDVEAWGLGYAFDSSPARRQTATGPDGIGGVLLGVGESLGFFPESQIWTKLPPIDGAPARWLGRPKPPAKIDPSTLRRSTQVPGHSVQLADGQSWVVPAAKRFDRDSQNFVRQLGSRLRVNEAGEWVVADVLPQFADLWEVATRWLDYTDDGSITIAEAADMCVTALSTNYRLSRFEVGQLGLLDDRDTVASVLNSVIDYQTFQSWCEQKKSTGGSPAAAG